jgi:HD-GYP domain-containing protein (c-di-GMP phosphodiesterase class II)
MIRQQFVSSPAFTETHERLIHVVMRDLAVRERTLGAQLLLRSLVDVYARFVDEDEPLGVADWVGHAWEAHGKTRGVARLFRKACRALASDANERGATPRHVASLHTLGEALESGRNGGSNGERQAGLDEVDAALSDVLRQLALRDPFAPDHARSVSLWSAQLARKLGLSNDDVAFAGRSGLIHDIGELSIPAELLNAPRRLNDEELAIVHTHTLAGEQLARANPLLAPFAGVARSHHERVDGGGYPDGLRGDEIPLMTRIVAVAECFAGMVGRRSYRAPLPPAAALQELVANSPGQFDPTIVAAMCAILPRR